MKDTIDAIDSSEKRERKLCSDKGLIMAARRDMYCIVWIAKQYALYEDR